MSEAGRRVRIEVQSRISDADGGAMELCTEAEGLYLEKGGKQYLRYEDEVSGGERSRVTLKIGDGGVTLLRRGVDTPTAYTQHFRLDEETQGLYEMAEGSLPVAVRTEHVAVHLEGGVGTAELRYRVSLAEGEASHHVLAIKVTEI